MTENNVSVFEGVDQEQLRRGETRSGRNYLIPAVDIHETEEALVLLADLPGLTREAIEIQIEKGVLTIQGRNAEEVKGDKLIREFGHGLYYRRFRIPDTLDPQKTKAEFRNGVLTLTLPRAEKAKPRRIEVAAA